MTDQHRALPSAHRRDTRIGTSWRPWLIRMATALLLAFSTLSVAVPADAHTGLVSSDPADNSSVKTTPNRIRLEFTDKMSDEFSKLSLTIGTSPQQVLVLDPTTDGSAVSVDLPADRLPTAPTGSGEFRWTLAYRVVSADGHPVDGKIRFNAPLPATPSSRDTNSQHASESPTEEPTSATQPSDDNDFRTTAVLIGVGVGLLLLIPLSILVLVIERDRRRRRSVSE